jgi:hypothetical protein
LPRGLDAQAISHAHSKPTASRQPNELHDVKEPLRHPCERLNEGGEPLGKDFAWAGAFFAKVFADLDEQTNELPCARQVGNAAGVTAMHTAGWLATERTAGGDLGRDKGRSKHFLSFFESHQVKSFGHGQDWLHVLHGASDPSLKHGFL